jgi:glycosyltransferase involved in cell wall biosynthesis
MKVLQLIHNLRAEGAQRVLVNLVSATDPQVIDQQVCAWKMGGPLAKQLQTMQVPLTLGDQLPLQGKSFFWRLMQLRHLICDQKIDLMHAHLSDAIMVAAFLKCLTGVPFVITHHCPDFMPPNLRGFKARLYAWVVRWAMRQAAMHIAISAAVQQSIITAVALHQANWQVVANGVPLPPLNQTKPILDFPLAMPARFRHRPILIAVGRLDIVKDVAQLIMAMPNVLAVMPDVRLAILGDGPLRGQLQAQIERLQLQSQIELVGLSTEVGAWLQQSTVFVSCSIYEGVPMALLEAMACGLPVVVSDVAGNRDVVAHLRTGWLYEKNEDNALISALITALQDHARAHQLGRAAAVWVREHYSQEAMASAYQRLYQQLVVSQ